MGKWTTTLTETAAVPATVKPKESWGKDFESSPAFSLSFPQGYSMTAFFDRRLKLGDSKQLSAYLAKDQIVARCLNCLGEEWEVRSESTGSGESGIVVYTAQGKALAAGTARVLDEGLHFSVATLYKGMTNRGTLEFAVEVTGNGDGTWGVVGTAGASRD